MIEYLKKLIRADQPESSKRVIALFAVLQIFFVIIVVLTFIFFKIVESDYINTILYVLAGLAGLNVTLSATQSIVSSKSKNEGTPTYPTYSPTTQDYDRTGNYNSPEKDMSA